MGPFLTSKTEIKCRIFAAGMYYNNEFEHCAIFTLLAAIMANIPVGQKQHRQVRTAGTIQSFVGGTGFTTTGTAPGCVTLKQML